MSELPPALQAMMKRYGNGAPPAPTPAAPMPATPSAALAADKPHAPTRMVFGATLDRDTVTDPDYPAEAQAVGEQGRVSLQFLCGVDGHLRDIKVTTSSGSERLDAATLATASTGIWRCKPVVDHTTNQAEESFGFYSHIFRLDALPPPPSGVRP
jgi:protein TonB